MVLGVDCVYIFSFNVLINELSFGNVIFFFKENYIFIVVV